MSRPLLLALTAGALLSSAGCAAGSLTAEELAEATEDALSEEVGSRPDVSCPEGIPEQEGATTRCTLSGGDAGVEYGVTITVTSVDGDPQLSLEVDDAPLAD